MNDRSRPVKAASESMATDAPSIALLGEISRQIGAETMMRAILDAGVATAGAARTIWIHPRFVELAKRREPDHRPCPARCRRCSRCIHSLAFYERGGRLYLGVDAEGALVGSL